MDWITTPSLNPSDFVTLWLCGGWQGWSTPGERKGWDEMRRRMSCTKDWHSLVSCPGTCSALQEGRGALSWWHLGLTEPEMGKRLRSLSRQGLHMPVCAIWFAINCKWLHIVYHRLAQGILERIMSCSWWQSETTVSLQVWLHILPLVQSSTHHHHKAPLKIKNNK